MRVFLPEPGGGERAYYLEAERIWDHLEDTAHYWYDLPLLQRLQLMRVCPSGLLQGPGPRVSQRSYELQLAQGATQGRELLLWQPESWAREVRAASELMALEVMAESYGLLPWPGTLLQQPAGLLEAFATIRAARNDAAARERKERERELRQKAGWNG